jgi:ABC-2 type transport system permease protein
MKFYRICALLLKYYYITINRADRLFDIFYWPVLDLFLWGFAAIYIEGLSNTNLLSMLLGGIILWMFVWRSSQDIAVFVLEDFWSRNLYHLFTSPIRLSEHVTSIILLGFLRSLFTFAFMIVVGMAVYSFNVLSFSPLLLATSVFLLSIFGWAMGLLVTSFIFRFGQRVQVLAWSVVFLLQPFACVFYPLSSLPEWAAKIAVLIPPTYVFEALRAELAGNAADYFSLFGSFIASLIFFIASAFFLAKSFKKAKQTGLLAKGD